MQGDLGYFWDVPSTGTAEGPGWPAALQRWGEAARAGQSLSEGGSGSAAAAAQGGRLKNSIDSRRTAQRWPGMHWQSPAGMQLWRSTRRCEGILAGAGMKAGTSLPPLLCHSCHS